MNVPKTIGEKFSELLTIDFDNFCKDIESSDIKRNSAGEIIYLKKNGIIIDLKYAIFLMHQNEIFKVTKILDNYHIETLSTKCQFDDKLLAYKFEYLKNDRIIVPINKIQCVGHVFYFRNEPYIFFKYFIN